MNTIVKHLSIALALLLMAGCGSEKKDYAERMETEHQHDAPVRNEASQIEQDREVTAETVVYATVDGNEVSGYLALPEGAEDALPGIVVIHEWWGLNDNIRMMTRRLAGKGYAALAVDLYNGQAADTPEKAKQYMQEAIEDPEAVLNNLEQAAAYLHEEQEADKVGIIGWCFGGGWSLRAALATPDRIDATVIYYGSLVQDLDELRKLNMPVLGFFGAEDRGIPVEEVKKFRESLNLLDIEAAIHIYEGANHAFANPSGTRYNKKAAEDAWKKTVAFFEEHLK